MTSSLLYRKEMISLKINGVMSIPLFLANSLEDETLHNLIFIFAESIINNTEMTVQKPAKGEHLQYFLEIPEKYKDVISDFINRYYELVELDRYYRCKYEERLGMPKSIMNEFFEIRFEDESTDRVVPTRFDRTSCTLILESIDK